MTQRAPVFLWNVAISHRVPSMNWCVPFGIVQFHEKTGPHSGAGLAIAAGAPMSASAPTTITAIKPSDEANLTIPMLFPVAIPPSYRSGTIGRVGRAYAAREAGDRLGGWGARSTTSRARLR